MTPIVLVDQRGSRRSVWWLAGTALAALIACVVGLGRGWSGVPPDAARVAAATAPFTLFAGREAAPTAPSTTQAASVGRGLTSPPALTCPYQRLDIVTSRGKSIGACVSVTRSTQSGDMRRYAMSAQGVSPWNLRIDSAPNGVVMAAELSSPGEGTFLCEEAACKGLRIGPRDAHGARVIDVAGALLWRVGQPQAGSPPAPDAIGSVALTARFTVASDEQDAQLACPAQSISIVDSSGGVLALCASGGGGAMLLDAHRVYRLRGSAGDTLDIGVDDAGSVDLVEFGDLSCHGSACGGAMMQAGGEAGRTFVFSGTTVTDGHPGGRSATLSGSAVLAGF